MPPSKPDARAQHADALLGHLHREGGGRLTIFLGAAPGVGKTYAMLARAHELARQGVDVCVGLVETHGRRETEALVAGLDVLPRRAVAYQGRTLEELDIDALLARHPAVALVDELAHRNAPGSRHARRWQDVIDLLDAGIDVDTTVNIQHLESLNDVVLRITGVRVSETVPDAVFDRLRDIVLVDLPPRELIERLRQGKVYVPDQAQRALQAFFSPANLAALRELAMQTAADRVDGELRDAQLASGLPRRSLRRRVLVAIDGRGQSEYLVRAGRRLAERRGAPWTAVTVQASTFDEPQQAEIDRAFALARRLGGDTELLRAGSIVDALLDHAEQAGVSTIVLGRTRERPFARMVNRTLTQQLLQRAAHFELTIFATPDARARARRAARRVEAVPPLSVRDIGIALAAAVLATLTGLALERLAGLDDLSMVFMLAVLIVATRTRMAAAVVAATLCFFAYNFFFLDPRYTLAINARQGVATVFLFLVAALVAGRLASRLRTQIVALRAANAHANALQALGRELATAADAGQIEQAGMRALKRATGADARVIAGDALEGALADLDERDRAAARWAHAHGQPAGRFTDTLGQSAWWFAPLLDERRALGLIALRIDEAARGIDPAQRRLLDAIADDLAQSLVRARLVADLEQARVSNETERLRTALLSSVSHDLRTPLASIVGATETLQAYGATMPGDDRAALLDTIRDEGDRLDRYIQNLLDMTRLGHGGLQLNRGWVGVDELVGSATRRCLRYAPHARFDIDVPAGLRPLWVHAALIEQALFNVVENAVRFTPEGAAIAVSARDTPDGVEIDVRDAGPGIPEDERQRIFDMFYSVERGDRRDRPGSGLGLTITQGMVGAHGGRVAALPGPDGRGTIVRLLIPRLEPDSAA